MGRTEQDRVSFTRRWAATGLRSSPRAGFPRSACSGLGRVCWRCPGCRR